MASDERLQEGPDIIAEYWKAEGRRELAEEIWSAMLRNVPHGLSANVYPEDLLRLVEQAREGGRDE